MTTKFVTGTVRSLSGIKTVAVEVSRKVQHKKYRKYINVSKVFLVDDPLSRCAVGDIVNFVNSRPISKRKHWSILYGEEQ